MDSDIDKVKRRYQREKDARLQAEEILEEKSRELFEKNQALEKLSSNLEHQVAERTKELSFARDEALAAAHAKSEFLANMSHELRTPMNGVLGMLKLTQGTAINDQQREYLSIAKSSGELLLSVINDILDFSKIEAGKMDLENLVFNPCKSIKAVISPLSFLAQEKGVEVTFKADSTMPRAIWGDSTRLKQIITNLVSNAVKFTDKGGVHVSLKAQGSEYVVQVKDTGMGMNQEQLQHIFEAFGQGDSSITRTHGGTGLGLTITNRLSQLMGGRVHVESEPGSGSSFFINLPLHVASEAELESSEQIKEGLYFSQQPILLVEDNKVNQKIALQLLKESNLNVSLAENGQEGLEKVQKGNYQLVLMDLQMPVMDGIEATRQIRKLESDKKDIPIIAMTAHASTEHIDECMRIGMNAHTTKPINIDSLLNVIAKWVKPSGSRNQELSAHQAPQSFFLIDGIDIAEVLERIKGNKELLKKLLSVFYENNQQFNEQLEIFLANNEIKKIEVLFHTLKGSAANISAKSVAKEASKLEIMAKNNDIEGINEHKSGFNKQLSALCSGIQKTLKSNKKETQPSSCITIKDDMWLVAIQQVASVVSQDFSEAEEILNKLKQYELQEEQVSLLSELLALADEFDMAGIENTIQNSQWGENNE